jgi:hypothetical protein
MELGNQLAGIDWGSVFGSIPAAATARGLALALAPIAGGSPVVSDHGGYSSLTFTAAQEERLAAWILTQLRREPGPVRVDASGIALRVIMRQYWPYMLGIAAAGALVAYAVRKGK